MDRLIYIQSGVTGKVSNLDMDMRDRRRAAPRIQKALGTTATYRCTHRRIALVAQVHLNGV